MKFHTIYDVLGYILSVILSEENRLREKVEFSKILFLYAQWCYILGGKGKNIPNRWEYWRGGEAKVKNPNGEIPMVERLRTEPWGRPRSLTYVIERGARLWPLLRNNATCGQDAVSNHSV